MPRTTEQNQLVREDRRQRILSSAAKLFAVKGLAATKIADIAQAAGMSQGLLYHYFRSKEDIFVEIVRRAFETMNAAARELEHLDAPPRQKLEMATVRILRGIEQGEDFSWYSTLISEASVSDAVPKEAKAIIRRERDVPYQVVARIVRAGQKEGSVSMQDADEVALVFWTTIKGLALHKAAYGRAFKAPNASIVTRIFSA